MTGIRATVTQRNGGFKGVGDRVAAKAPAIVTNSAHKLGERVQEFTRDRAYDTGALFSSVEVQPAGGTAQAEVSIGGGEVDYAGYVNDGTIYMWPRRNFSDAVAEHQREFGREMATELKREMT